MLSLSRSALAVVAASLLVSEGVLAHMALSKPPPLRSTLNKQYDHSNFDYSMTAPLNLDGSNFPCKGYNTDVPGVSTSVETLKAGSSFTASFAPGGAKHEGGSCQFALSYDGGKSFGVIHSVIGGCPMQESYTFKIPSNVPAGKNILFSWTWFNKVGNREMYQNCAAVDIESSSTAPLKVPRIFEANIFGAGTCNTVEQDELVFPNPGESVEYGGIWSGKKPTKDDLKITNCPDDKITGESSFVTLSGNGAAGGGSGADGSTPSASAPEKTPETAPQTSSQASGPPATLSLGRAPKSSSATQASATPSGAPAPSSAPVASSSKATLALGRNRGSSTVAPSSIVPPSTAPKVSSAPAVPGMDTGSATCSGDGMRCSAGGQSFSVCSSGAWVNMGSVAPGTVCKDGAIALAPASTGTLANTKSSCKPNELKCSTDGTTFSVCNADGTGVTDMGSVAPGTKCTNGSIVLARRMKHKRASGRGTRRLESTKH